MCRSRLGSCSEREGLSSDVSGDRWLARSWRGSPSQHGWGPSVSASLSPSRVSGSSVTRLSVSGFPATLSSGKIFIRDRYAFPNTGTLKSAQERPSGSSVTRLSVSRFPVTISSGKIFIRDRYAFPDTGTLRSAQRKTSGSSVTRLSVSRFPVTLSVRVGRAWRSRTA